MFYISDVLGSFEIRGLQTLWLALVLGLGWIEQQCTAICPLQFIYVLPLIIVYYNEFDKYTKMIPMLRADAKRV